MDQLSLNRFAVLQNQGSCPACGSLAWVHSGDQKLFTALYKCGAVFDVRAGAAIKHLTPCPAPSSVAAAALERQAMSATWVEQENRIGGAA